MTANPEVLYEDILPGGSHWSFVANQNVQLQLVDMAGGGNVAMLAYNPANPLERLNLPDSLKCQHTFRLTQGHCLYSDMGRIFCSIVADDVGWHDASCGTCNAGIVRSKWGSRTYQDARNDYFRNGRDSFLVELGKYGLGKRDFAANVNWFSRVNVGGDGGMHYVVNHTSAGQSVTLRFEMPTLVVLHTCPHPLNPASEYPRRPIVYRLSVGEPAAEDDACKLSREENARGFMNNYLYSLGK
ncbi:MAG: urea carboxylase-associated family protein [Gammaproteobacteria bacterium]|nr:urea carboxylase-associated family protein [Gammaproteobacteria bacterium]